MPKGVYERKKEPVEYEKTEEVGQSTPSVVEENKGDIVALLSISTPNGKKTYTLWVENAKGSVQEYYLTPDNIARYMASGLVQKFGNHKVMIR